MSILHESLPDSFEERIETEHLILRPYQEGDESDFMRLLQENAAILNPAFGGRLARVRALDDARTQVKQLRTEWDNRKVFDFGVWMKPSKEYIGDIALKNLDHRIPKAELGLYFTSWPDTREQAIEALQAILKFAFDTLALNKVYMRCTASNLCFGELVEDIGFLKEGVMRSDYKGADSDELLDLIYYGMTRQDYEHMQQHEEETNSTAMA
ncbi:RimJ/RimL family protein N-acetyltransferase [Pontibacter aydingkolensis]|uniref:GNAT family N-acetyltransferase n=1 Tax=Pontibacter aydingkolensis TaxID=1911536 RepID=A0ABS7CPI4_9BACT|nr:GNAT family protein [Pontibacter aydingkolensis]MBW7465668.1 GNAT family N-acetyltransferase [Pontibacter aydingkolensis]